MNSTLLRSELLRKTPLYVGVQLGESGQILVPFAMPVGTFVFTGVHNPTTGRFTVLPGLYTEHNPDEKAYRTFFADGFYNPESRTFVGDADAAWGLPPDQFLFTVD